MPSRVLLEQFASEFPTFCKVGMGYNKKIKKRASGFIAVTDSVHLLKDLKFEAAFVDEAHHPLPPGMPESKDLYLFSATHRNATDFDYSMGQAIEDGVLCDYDLTIPVITEGHAYLGLSHLLLQHPGRFRRVLAYCNTVREAQRFQRTLELAGMAAWHINGFTKRKLREEVVQEFAGRLQKPVHVLVTVQVLGEGVNIPSADTCMFVEPRESYRSIVQAIGRILRLQTSKPLAHIILPGVTMPAEAHVPVGPSCEEGLNAGAGAAASNSWDLNGLAVDPGPSSRSVQPQAKQEAPGSAGSESKATSTIQGLEALSDSTHAMHMRASGHEGVHVSESLPADVGQTESTSSKEFQANTFPDKQLPVGTTGQLPTPGCEPKQVEEPRTEFFDDSDAWRTSTQPYLKNDHGSVRALALTEDVSKSELLQQADVEAVRASKQPVMSPRQRVKLSIGADTQRQDSFATQLERFLSILAHADSRLTGSSWNMLGSRVWFADCRTSQATFLAAAIKQSWFRQLAILLRCPDRWEARMQQLEDFVEHYGRLPRLWGDRQEIKLSTWLAETGKGIKQGGMAAAQRLQRCLNSPSPLVRRRAQSWQDPDKHFREGCAKLKDFLDRFQCLPPCSGARADVESKKLRIWLQHQRQALLTNPNSPRQSRRLQTLTAMDPIVEQFMQPPYKKRGSRHALKVLLPLQRFVAQTGELPSRHSTSAEERNIYASMAQLRRKFLQLTPKQRLQVVTSHSLIASFMEQLHR